MPGEFISSGILFSGTPARARMELAAPRDVEAAKPNERKRLTRQNVTMMQAE
jgi:hypothetical protein